MNGISSSELSALRALLAESQSVLLVPSGEHALDTLPAALGLASSLERDGKRAEIFYPYPIPRQLTLLDFAPYLFADTRTPALPGLTNLALGEFGCMITLGISSLERIGPLGEAPAEFFFQTPIINIDVNPENARYGALSLCDPASFSCAELCAKIVHALWGGRLEARAATPLLAGVFASSDTFRRHEASSSTLRTASELLEQGADHQMIVRNLYKMNSATLVRLLGASLMQAQWDEAAGLWTAVCTWRDLQEAGAGAAIIPELLRELRGAAQSPRCVLLVWEDAPPSRQTPAVFRALVASQDAAFLDMLCDQWHAVRAGSYIALGILARDGYEARTRITEGLKKFLV